MATPDDWKIAAWHDLSADDVHDLLKLRQDVFIVEQRCCYADIDGADRDAWHLLLRDADQELLACARLFEPSRQADEAVIGRVIVAAAARSRGLGEQLVGRAVAWCRQRFPDAGIRIAAQAHLQDFYARCGFAPAGHARDVDGIPHIDMLWQPRPQQHD